MGLFKSKEQKKQEQQNMRLRIEQSEAAQLIRIWFLREFSDTDGDRVRKLRNGYLYRLDVDRSGFVLSLFDRKYKSMSKEGATFADLGYEYLPAGMSDYLRQFIADTLAEIPYLRIIDGGGFTLITAGDHIKSSW